MGKTLEYSLNYIVINGLMPGVKSYPTALRIVLEDKMKPKADRLLDATIIGEGRGRTIRVRSDKLEEYNQANK